MNPREWVEFMIDLPSGSSVEIDIGEHGSLRCEIDCHNDTETLVQVEDALRGAVNDVRAARGRFEP